MFIERDAYWPHALSWVFNHGRYHSKRHAQDRYTNTNLFKPMAISCCARYKALYCNTNYDGKLNISRIVSGVKR